MRNSHGLVSTRADDDVPPTTSATLQELSQLPLNRSALRSWTDCAHSMKQKGNQLPAVDPVLDVISKGLLDANDYRLRYLGSESIRGGPICGADA